uniref:pentatricopeptide repeat-containing protein At2g17525, mitochondrial isoform X3 n=1 Tax=Fragaria vesca subsp. vesca TaxID=101020 RepID=UPI0005CB442E|nr:PREDICTED: pentatricopeptide repeat-containing protein At2g17525, mitochondrial isoform X3 [Fragaria vesca subsp. vesca]
MLISKLPHVLRRTLSSISVPSHTHIAHLLLEQKSATQVLDTFQWASTLPSFTHSPSTYRALIHKLCTFRRFDTAYQVLDEMPRSIGQPPDEHIFVTLIHGLGRAHLVKQAIKVLDLVARNGKVGRARSLMNEMEDPNDVTFNILISGYCGEENLVQAVVMLDKCFGLGYVPDVVTITKVLELLCNDGRVMEAVKVLERVESNGGLVDVVAYNTLIKGFCQLGKAKLGLRILKEMERKGCLPDVDTYNVLISGFCESGMLDKALDLFNDMKTDGINWNFATYDVLIRGLCSGGRTEDGLKILDLMNESKDGCRGRISPFNSVLYGLYKENRLDEALEFLASLGKLFPRAVDRSLRILGFCEEGATENAKKLYDQMILERAVPCVLIYDYLIHRFCQQGCVRQAFELMNEMIVHCYFPVASTFNVLINGFCKQGKVDSALKLLEEMVGRGCLPDIDSYSHLVGVLCQKGDFQKALTLLFQMVEKGITPDHFTWNSLLVCTSLETVWLNSKSMLYANNQLDCIIKA